ncbi:DUF72 domain-containing protein [Halomonas sp. McH1-25]|uniref:DUF72 domain-containing protein n=1 Tax=unclassified Halomonas TaxID=2609666 RepID=UPI001EF49667|nr:MULTISPECIES: DUF72 domain-containing protein [unclassified Halomonas]MCG7599659.1 DUF72 domain-containing protein [Halomonas sp. McH1-25]MCP1342579.1 DUF72 domain-containing protein [Halomonas sp. FL8]MCP1363474.1 DUF72 domain-containing protein [Halomonas sp. BBD45]
MTKLFLGLPMWANAEWRGGLYARHAPTEAFLEDYAHVFSSVEGNTTFYSGAPRPETVDAWARQAPADFRFCFKLPASLTHERRLVGIEHDLEAFLDRLSPLHDRLGPMMIQLPRDFGPDELPQLENLLACWPQSIPCAVEVRASEFFHKGSAEQQLNRLLITHGVDRVMLDVRPLFSTPAENDSRLYRAQQEKPKRPLHVLSTASNPIVRFIGHFDWPINERYFEPWIERLDLWIKQGKTPFLFVHTPDNRLAPQLARHLHSRLSAATGLPELNEFPGECQNTLF